MRESCGTTPPYTDNDFVTMLDYDIDVYWSLADTDSVEYNTRRTLICPIWLRRFLKRLGRKFRGIVHKCFCVRVSDLSSSATSGTAL